MAELDVTWAGLPSPQETTADDFYGRYVAGTQVAVFGDATTAPPLVIGAYSKGDDAGLWSGHDPMVSTVWSLVSFTPAFSQQYAPTMVTTYFWG